MTRTERQDISIVKWKNIGGKGTIVAAPGFGKTRIALNIIKRLVDKKKEAKILVVVPTEYLQGQWVLLLGEWNLLQNVKVLIINSVIKKEDSCDLMVCDEVHEYAAKTFSNVFKCITYKLLLCLTGTFERLDGKEQLIKQYAPICDEIPIKMCIENGWIAKYEEYKVLIEVDLAEYYRYNASFLNHFSFFNYDFHLAIACLGNHWKRKEYANKIGSTDKEVLLHAVNFGKSMRARKEFVWDHPKKVELANLIISHREDKKIITFSQTKATAEKICKGNVMHSGQTKKKRAQIMEEFNLVKTGVLNSAKALERGADIANLSVSITLSFNSSAISKNQKNGRPTRKEGDKESEIFTFVIKGTVEEEWFRNSAKGLKVKTIDEQQLLDLLKGNPIVEKKEAETQMLFRF